MLGHYEGRFANKGLLAVLSLTDVPLPGNARQAAIEAYQVVENIPPVELHQLALKVQAEIVRQATVLVEDDPFLNRPFDESGRAQFDLHQLSDDQRLALVDERRLDVGDTQLWLMAAAGRAEGRDALCLAVLALWKADALKRATAQLLACVANRSSTDLTQLWNSVEDVTRLTGEVVRAGTLAADTANLNSAIRAAHAAGAELKAKELQSIADQRLREAAALGGQRKAQKYQPARDRAEALYRAGSYPSRNKAATAIYSQLEAEGLTVAHSTVLEYLTEVDRRIEAGRNEAASGK